MQEIYIKSEKLVELLKISSEKLIEVEKFFDSISDDEWDLIDGIDYQTVKRNGLREYTQSGIYKITRYLHTKGEKSLFQQIKGQVKEFILSIQEKRRKSIIHDHIMYNCSSLMKKNNQFLISKTDVINIFKTNSKYITKILETAKKSNPLIKDQDYINLPDSGVYFSLSGINKIASVMRENQTNRNRKLWCGDIEEVVVPSIENIVQKIVDREKNIQKVMTYVKEKRDHKTCLVSGEKWNKINALKLAAHHLYSKQEYPLLADVETNLITISCDIHQEFHVDFMGGTDKSCTVDDFIEFINQYYPESIKAKAWLINQKLVLGDPATQRANNSHVLHLPASRVS